jgi:uncharacterized membrane protein SpoIIM required for sporulation
MKQQLFEIRYGPEWVQFEEWLAKHGARDNVSAPWSGGGTRDRVAPPFDAAELPQRYRRLCHQLALARDRRYGTDLVARLHRLAIEVHQLLYGARHEASHTWLGYIFGGFARRVRAQRRYVLAAALLFFVPFVAMLIVTQVYPEAIYYLMSPKRIAEFETMYGPAAQKLGRRGAESDFYMLGFYIANNVKIAFQTFAGGLLFGFGALFFLVFNGIVLGAVEGHVTAIGYGTAFHSFVAGHSALELGGIVLSGAAGLRLGLALLAPGRLTRKEALGVAGRDAAGIMYGVAGMIVAAAFVEAFWSSIGSIAPAVKYGVGIALGVLVLAYFLLAGRARAA